MNDTIVNDMAANVPFEAEALTIFNEDGALVSIPVEGEVQAVQDAEFSDVPAGN